MRERSVRGIDGADLTDQSGVDSMGPKVSPHAPLPLRRWLWRSYLRAALVPLLLIELGFLATYWATTNLVYDRGAEVVTRISTGAIADTALREAEVIARRLQTVTALTHVYATETGRALATPASPAPDEVARHALSPEGAFYKTVDDGGSAVFVSGAVPVDAALTDKVWRTVRLDPVMKSIVSADPLITQVYLNTHDSFNRIYPFFDVLATYAPGMNIPDYNFYYEADASHNPDRGVVWTDAYLDPAGSGWMVSAIAPVYGPDRLEAVVGIDVTIAAIVDEVLDIDLDHDGYAILVSRDGTILALPPQAEADFGLGELTADYRTAVLQDTFKPEAFNVYRRPELAELVDALGRAPSGHAMIDLGRPLFASWGTVTGPEWKLIVLKSEAEVLGEARSLREQLAFISYVMLGILVLFYLGFFAFLWIRSIAMSRRVAQPLAEIEANMARIAEGGRLPATHAYGVTELQALGDHLVTMGDKLDAASRAKSSFLSAMSHELRTPLNAILGLSDLLQNNEKDPARRRMAAAISAAGKHLLALVEGAMDLARIEKHEIRPKLGPVDIVQAAQAVVDDLRAEAREQGLTVTVTPPPDDLPAPRADAEILGRILQQMVGNAIKYNRAKGSIGIAFAAEDQRVTVTVTDSGMGIAPDRMERLFTPFDRLGHENSTIAGTGVGLVVAQRLAGLMGGNITARSREGEGSVFVLSLPKA